MPARRIAAVEGEADATRDGAALGGALVDICDGMRQARGAERGAAAENLIAGELEAAHLHGATGTPREVVGLRGRVLRLAGLSQANGASERLADIARIVDAIPDRLAEGEARIVGDLEGPAEQVAIARACRALRMLVAIPGKAVTVGGGAGERAIGDAGRQHMPKARPGDRHVLAQAIVNAGGGAGILLEQPLAARRGLEIGIEPARFLLPTAFPGRARPGARRPASRQEAAARQPACLPWELAALDRRRWLTGSA